MAHVLETELRTYEEKRGELLATGRGRFVLIHGASVHGLFDSESAGVAEGYRLFGPDEAFFVRRVESKAEEEATGFLGSLSGPA